MATTSLDGSGQAGVLDAKSDLLGRFEEIYREAGGDHTKIPWAHSRACPWLMNWLDAEGGNYVRPGARVCVVGCGLGTDAAALAEVLAEAGIGLPFRRVGVRDQFCEGGTTPYLMKKFGLDSSAIAEAARDVVARKG